VKTFRHLSKACGQSIDCNKSIVPLVPALMFRGGPAAVIGRVIPIIVNAIKRPPLLAYSHVFCKVFKGKPPFTNLDSATSIIVKPREIGISAPVEHVFPDDPDSRIGHPVPQRSFGCFLSSVASARNRATRLQIVWINLFFNPAFATAYNHSDSYSFFETIRRISNHFELSKSESYERFSGRHGIGVFNVVFSGVSGLIPGIAAIKSQTVGKAMI
jgi:hypothetical protein